MREIFILMPELYEIKSGLMINGDDAKISETGVP